MLDQTMKNAQILIVDDQQANVRVLERLLAREGYTHLKSTTDARQVLPLFSEFQPDLILLDLLMPYLDGFAVLEQLRPVIPADSYLPILVLTADITPEAKQRALSSGAKDFLTKPLELVEVSLRIRNLLETRYLYLQLHHQNQILEEQVRERTTDLTRANDELTRANAQLQTEIVERKQAEEKLRESEERYRRFFENMHETFVIQEVIADDAGTPIDLRYLDVNPAAERILGKTRSEIVGRTRGQLSGQPDPEGVEMASRVASTGTQFHMVRYSPGFGRWFESFTYSFGSGIVATLALDITERKQAEAALAAKNEEIKAMSQQLWQVAKLATMGELAASVAHELNNPLGTVSLRIESLLGQVPADDPQHRELEVVEQEVERMSTLVASLLQFSRRSTPQISTLDVREEIENTLELIHYLLRQRQITVQREFAPDVPMVQADRQKLRQLFLNLFTNASDAMPQGGTLAIRVSAAPAQHQVLIEIADTGQGIASEDLAKVMEPFFTTKPEGKGTGLGLAICRRIVQEHNGIFEITSVGPGHGATVRLTLPGKNESNGAFLREA